MKRRTFLQHTSTAAVTLPLVLNGNKLSAFTQHALFKGMQQDSDKVLVLIQMNGGNDGLNMVLPLDQYSNLFLARENILIPETSALKLTDKTGLHPAMSGLHQTYMNGQLAVFQGVGYPNQNRSHFRSTDIWQSASGATEVINTGWLGRHFDDYAVGYPDGYPNAQYPDPFAITIGSTVNETCQGNLSNYSLALTNPFGLSPLLEDDDTTSDPTQCYGKEIAFVRTSIAQTNAYSEVITAAALIMFSVFAVFTLSHLTFLKLMGFAMATAIVFDAFLVRMVIMPTAMLVLGEKSWWMPQWLDRILPNIDVEGDNLRAPEPDEDPDPQRELVPA